jgi:glycosyltransferase involved in cell wall biosynthesis
VKKLRLLYIHPATMGPEVQPRKNAFSYLSRYFEGDYVASWLVPDGSSAQSMAAAVGPAMGDFRFHWTRSVNYPAGIRQLWDLLFFVGTAVFESMRRGRYDLVVAYGPFRTGLAGYLIRVLTRSPLVLELPGHPTKTLEFAPGMLGRWKRRMAPHVVSFLVRRADHVRLLYPTQLDGIASVAPDKMSVFHDFVPIKSIRGTETAEGAPPYILFLGYPWYLKGVDVLIRAFQMVSPRYPEYGLKVVGHCPDRSQFEALAQGNPRIELKAAMPHEQAMRLMEECSIFVLPSRTEAMGRVLLEAMAAAKPIVASNVDGIPHYVKHGDTGLLFRSEDAADLAEKLETLMRDRAYAQALGRKGHDYVHNSLSEERYAEYFRTMAAKAIG